MSKEYKKDHIMKQKNKSTYDAFIEDAKQKKLLDQEYRDLLVSELLLASMKEDHISVRKLAAMAGVSPTIIQELRAGNRLNLTIDTLFKILNAIGYQIILAPKSDHKRFKVA